MIRSELPMSIRKKSTCASVYATGGTLNIKNGIDRASDGMDGGTGRNYIIQSNSKVI